ncbi:hypothetical protein CHS0354_022784 [Potamilus streckersoni]|uniref:Link domain-containing protein n=1 Tax=Potamilus streckersoni TaxID=2493646 RepID=A0AAE0S1V3_9BIVA|nr:hypothetical protein CHS0354_022784 [Potamilus streckersoni]
MDKNRFCTMSLLLLLICCGFCLCKERYFGVVHDDFQKLCVVVTLPGKQNGPDPDLFQANWNNCLNIAGKKIFNSSDRNEQLRVAEEHCKKLKPDNDPKCAFRDLSIIGNLVKQDVRKLQETLGFKLDSAWYFYAHYILAWFQHPMMIRLDCGPTLKNLWLFLAKMSRLPSFDLLFRMKSVYDNANAKGLRQEIDRFCLTSSTQQICEVKILTNAADKVEKLLNYVGRGQWDNSASEILKNAMRLHFYTVKLTFLKLHPSSAAREFLSTTDSEVSKWIKGITLNLFDSIQKNRIESISRVIELLPYTVDLPCDHAAEFPSLGRTLCTFNSMINSLTLYLASKNSRGNVKQISTSIDYEKFLQEKRFEQILNIGETTQYTLLLVAQHLKLEMKNNFGELKKYFQQLAEFDWKKASADIAYIDSTLSRYKDASAQSANKMDGYMDQLIRAALAAAIGDQVEAALKLSFAIAEACNPLSIIFTGGGATGVLDATQGVSQAMANVAKAAKLKDAFDALISEIRKFVDKLKKNEIYLNTVTSLINSLKKNALSSSSSSPSSLTPEFEAQKNKFLDDYNNYTPAVTKDDLKGITVYWENLIDEACDLLDATSGTVSGITKTVLAAKRICPNAKVEVQKLIATYEEIYDFQFKLMDALATCMRAVTAYQAANVINSDFDAAKLKNADNPEIFAELEMLSAFSMICYKISMLAAIDSYCDILTYTEGHLPRECIGTGTSITSLLSRTKLTCSTMLEFQRIPTKPSGPGDKAYISLKELYAGQTAVFKIPDSQWLIDHNWILSSQKNDKMFVQRFEIYLPVVSKTKKQIQVKVQSTVGNQLTPPDGTEYVISPRPTLWYTYREGESGSECRQEEFPNPYNDNCRDMPKICPVTKELSNCANRGNICPSIYTQWNINIYGYENANMGVPSTDIPLRVALQLCSLRESEYALMQLWDDIGMSNILSAVRQPMSWEAYHSESFSTKGTCCGSNHYYDDSTSKCTACPSGSVDKYKGLLCGSEIQFVPAPINETTFSFDFARTMCTKAGTTIASKQVMHRAVTFGYDACGCGWFSDGIMRAPKPNVRCKDNGCFSTVTCSTNNTWGVYCVNNF